MTVVFDTGPLDRGTRFSKPRRIIRADGPEEVEDALRQIAEAQARKSWLAGYFSYELGYCLLDRLKPLLPEPRHDPLILLGEFDDCEIAVPEPADRNPPRDLRMTPLWSETDYAAAFSKTQDYIAAGDCYQINLTFPIDVQCAATPAEFYRALRTSQPVGHGAFVDLGGPVLLSRSPELFFQVDPTGRITTRPMKGTIARGPTDEEDDEARDWLERSEKNRAENLMIVDLLRNDISRIAEVGSVKVPRLFTVEAYATVHQMTSTVTARLLPGTTLPDILQALYPSGSIIGAPKVRAMEIIRSLEPFPRGPYCGAIGWVAPDGAMSFNVAIRTLVDRGGGCYALNVGGGVVHDSDAAAEYEEALWKSRFARLPGTT
ncbi:MAG: aminodeoxychorismate synthase component I [Pseudomonadota bacterium]